MTALLNHLAWWALAWLVIAAPTAVLLGLCIAAADRRELHDDTDVIVIPEAWLR